MSRRGRPSHMTPTVEWKCHIPIDVAVKIDMINLDPVRGTPAYGARSALVTRLLREYLDTLAKSPENGDVKSSINLPK